MGFFDLFRRKPKNAPTEPVGRDIPPSALTSEQTLRCDSETRDPERRFSVGHWGLKVADDAESQRLAKAVLKRSGGKSLRLEPVAGSAIHRGVISSSRGNQAGGGYRWIDVEVSLPEGVIRFTEGGTG